MNKKKPETIEELVHRTFSSSWSKMLLFGILTAFVVLLNGYHIGTFDQVSHIPFLKKNVDTTLYPNDPFFALREYHYSYFWFFFIPFVYLHALEISLFLTYLFVIFFTFWVVWRLSFTLFRNLLACFLSVIFFAMPHLGFAGFTVFEFSLINRTFVLPFLLLAIDLYLKKRYYLSFVLLGVLYNIHVISVHFVLALLFVDALFRLKTVGVKNLLTSLFLFALPTIPILAWKFGKSPVDFSLRPEWFDILNRSLMHTVFVPISNEPEIMLLTLGGICSILIFFFLRKKLSHVPHIPVLTHFFVAIIAVLIVEVVATSGFPSTLIIQTQIIRIGLYAVIFSYLTMAEYLSRSLSNRTLSKADIGILTSASILSLSPLILFVALLLQKIKTASLRRTFSIAFILISFVGYFIMIQKSAIWDPSIHIFPEQTPWVQTQEWAKAHTAKDALFITPPYMWWFYTSEWRVFSERGTVVTLADLLEVAFEPSYLPTWTERFNDVAPHAAEKFRGDALGSLALTKQAYDSLSTTQMLAVAKKYHASYIVVEKPKLYPFLSVYTNSQFTIYAAPTKK